MFEFFSNLREAGLRFLVIGGHALSFYAVTRETADLDLLVSRDESDRWKGKLIEMGYALFHRGENFAQFTPPEQGAWPVDLMLVAEATFQKMWTRAQEVELLGHEFAVPCLEHLLALKLHALRYTHPRRTIKDFQDVVDLVQANSADLDIESERTRALFERYGTLEWYEKVRRACQK